MDPVTAGLLLAAEVVKLISKVYDDTPLEQRQKDRERWDRFVDRCEALLERAK
jgi:hypothetical protein